MLQRYHRVFNHHTVTAMLTRSSSQSLTLRSFQTLISPTTILKPQPRSVHAPRLNSSMFATTAHEFQAPTLNSVQAKRRASVMDKWKEMVVVPDVRNYIDGEYVKVSMSVRAYYADRRVNVRSLENNYRPNCVTDGYPPFAVLGFGNAKIGLGSITWSDNISYMVVFDYGSVILLNVPDSEVSDCLKIVKLSKGKIPNPDDYDLDLIPEDAPHRLLVYREKPYCNILLAYEGGGELDLCRFKI